MQTDVDAFNVFHTLNVQRVFGPATIRSFWI